MPSQALPERCDSSDVSTRGPSEFTVLSLFSGIGGLDLGLEASGMRVVGSVEIDSIARSTIALNREWPHLEPHDVEKFAASKSLPTVDVLAGAPPCQPFSKAAQWHPESRVGLKDDRGLLIFSILDVVARSRPKVVVLENVEGFVRGSTSVLEPLQRALPEIESATGLRYSLDWRILDAHGFGVPQRRKRAFVILSRVGPITWPTPAAAELRPVAWDAIGKVRSEPELQAAGKWAGLLPSIPEGKNYQWHTNRGGGLPLFGYRTRYWQFLLKLAKHEPSWTLAAQPGPSTGPFHWDSRPLTGHEMLRLQGFPEDWKVDGDRRSVVKQIGNATPPPLAEAVGRSISALLGRPVDGPPTLAIERRGKIPDPEPVGDVPSEFLHLQRAKTPDHPGAGLGPSPRVSPVGAD